MQEKYITVAQLTRYIKFKIDNDQHLNHIFLKGEISNFKAHTRGHYYFTLKDETSRINAVMFASSASKLKFMPEDGMRVLITGRISVYEATGGYQIYVEDLVEDGIGNLYIQYEKLKRKLELEGLFDPSHKRKIPRFPSKIGIVTAPTGAAIRDILSTLKRRWPIAEAILFPSLVQGASAASEIVRQIEKAQEFDIDLLIVGRGGGSIEDMWCFNDEEVARVIYNCKVPTISAVGHEIDFTIADFVADLRAPTPTGAAEMAVPNVSDFNNYFNQMKLRLMQNMSYKMDTYYKKLDKIQNSYILKNPIAIYEVKEQKFDALFEKMNFIMTTKIQNYQNTYEFLFHNLNSLIQNQLEKLTTRYLNTLNKLEILNPLLTIKRGYSIVKKNNQVLTSVKRIKKDDTITINVTDGEIDAVVLNIKEEI
ncbi:MAG: exodeoxyribonuclease VII large subunit [bacterium]|nr:exodeoxyribonuclease VII large subunit [bacterium]